MGAEQNKVEDSLRVLTGLFGSLPSVEGLGSGVSFSLSPWRALSCVDQYPPQKTQVLGCFRGGLRGVEPVLLVRICRVNLYSPGGERRPGCREPPAIFQLLMSMFLPNNKIGNKLQGYPFMSQFVALQVQFNCTHKIFSLTGVKYYFILIAINDCYTLNFESTFCHLTVFFLLWTSIFLQISNKPVYNYPVLLWTITLALDFLFDQLGKNVSFNKCFVVFLYGRVHCQTN